MRQQDNYNYGLFILLFLEACLTRNVPIGVIGNVKEAMQFFRFRYLCHNLLAIHSPEIEGDSC
ncbi:hypothetical protein GQ600_16282 [Phytophthora cactorum]|nr:hypothetical protein GQ600_16282 [Phytophthora cactorum]